MGINVTIVDDEESGINVLQQLLHEYFPQINITQVFRNIADAEKGIRAAPPDILFLDIQMPGGNGFMLLENLGTVNFPVVFVTAYDRYAIKALKLSAADYLLKPISYTDLKFAVEKSLRMKSFYGQNTFDYKTLLANSHVVDADKALVVNKYKGDSVKLAHIVCVLADSNYCIIHTVDKKRISVTKPLKELEETLCEDGHRFLRIHKSVIVNTDKISDAPLGGDPSVLHLCNGFSFQVAKRKKDEVAQILNKRSRLQ